jgi:hypothetical protein
MTAYDWLQGLFLHQIDLDAQEIAEIVFQGYELQQPHFGIVDLDQEIKVAALPGLAPDIGAEDAQGPDLPLLGKLGLMLLQDLIDIVQGARLNSFRISAKHMEFPQSCSRDDQMIGGFEYLCLRIHARV